MFRLGQFMSRPVSLLLKPTYLFRRLGTRLALCLQGRAGLPWCYRLLQPNLTTLLFGKFWHGGPYRRAIQSPQLKLE
jgi:hypothetical protein